MEKRFFVWAMLIVAVFLVLGPVWSFAAPPATADRNTSGQDLSPDQGKNDVCTYKTMESPPSYYRGRMGQLEHSAGDPRLREKTLVECKVHTSEGVKIIKSCPN